MMLAMSLPFPHTLLSNFVLEDFVTRLNACAPERMHLPLWAETLLFKGLVPTTPNVKFLHEYPHFLPREDGMDGRSSSWKWRRCYAHERPVTPVLVM